MTHKKRCECGYVVSAQSIKAVAEAIRDHAEHGKCDAMNAKNV